MIDNALIEDILALYDKHGWNISRVLLSEPTRKGLGEAEIGRLFNAVAVRDSEFDGAWFVRPARNGMRALELRHLNENPFALFELLDDSVDEIQVREKQKEIELRMAVHASKRRSDPA